MTFDEIFAKKNPAAEESPKDNGRTFDLEAWRQRKIDERTEVFGLADETALEVASNENAFRKFLDVQAHFLSYTSTNALLIMAQCPDAKLLRTYDEWKAHGESVLRGHGTKHIKIISSGKPYTREDGSVGTGWDVRRVYDIADTTASDSYREADKISTETLFRCLIDKSDTKANLNFVASDSLPNGMEAFYSPENQTILVKRFGSLEESCNAVMKEVAHAFLACGNDAYVRADAESTALCAAYVVSKRYGLNVDGYSFASVIDTLSDPSKDSREIRGFLSDVRTTAKNMSFSIDRSLDRRTKEKTDQDSKKPVEQDQRDR